MRDFSNTPGVEVFTLHDLVHRLSLRAMGDSTPKNTALFTRAIQDAIRGLPAKNDWTYYKRQSRLTTVASFISDVEYDHTGGAHERMLTITSDDTWPASASLGEIVISGRPYRVLRRISDTVITLEEDFALSADFEGEAWWQRRTYQFSREITRVHEMHSVTTGRFLTFLPSSKFQDGSYALWGRGSTSFFTFQNNGTKFGTTEMLLWPSPLTAEVIEVTATVNPHIPKIALESGTGAVVTADSPTVTVAGAAFTSRLVGTIFRLGLTSDAPKFFDSDRWEFQAFVTAVPSATTLTLSEVVPTSGSALGYSMSSPIDIDAATMLEHVEDEAYAQYTKNHDHKSLQVARQLSKESLRMALVRDNSRVSLNGYAWDYGYWSDWYGGFYSEEEEDE